MSDKFNRIVESFFAKEEKLFGALELQRLISEQYKHRLNAKRSIIEDKSQNIKSSKPTAKTITYNSIADIAVSELGWANISTKDAGIVDDSKRQQLEQYLKNISGNNFDEKIKAVNSFYTASMEELISKGVIKAGTRSEKIQQMLSYLVFLKTLTTIITNFNASAAGFAFESFLGVLLNGKQIPAGGANTIADVTIEEDGKTVYASLKLYAESSLEVGGSFKDLANDMMDPKKPFIRYIAGLKSLSGKGLDMEGRVSFHKFDINIENVMNILVKTSRHSRDCIVLPQKFIQSNGAESFEFLTKIEVEDKQIRKFFHSSLHKNLLKTIKTIKNVPSPKLEVLVQRIMNKVYSFEQQIEDFYSKAKGKESKLGYASIKKTYLKQIMTDVIQEENNLPIKNFIIKKQDKIVAAIEESVDEAHKFVIKASSPEAAQKATQSIKWATPELSAEFYNGLSVEQKKIALRNTLGYLSNRQFSMSKTQMFSATEKGAEKIGEIIIGKRNIQEILSRIGGELDDSVFEIFDNLSLLTTNINKYFATGLQDDSAADTAQVAAQNIDKKTEEVQTNK